MRLLALDGNSIINRAFYGVKPLTTKDGLYTNALFGFLNIFLKLREQTGADHIAAAFDLPAPTFRHKLYDEYKAGRKGMPDELHQQLPLLKELLTLLGVTVVEAEGYEADDILGTLSAAAEEAGGECFIATGDRDSLQLVDGQVFVLLAATKMGRPETTVYDPAAIREKYGLEPSQLIDLKALMGDASDHIPGVPGVGEKTALDLMHKFGSLDGVYANIASPDIRDSLRKKLTEGKDSAYLSQKLGAINREVPVSTDMGDYAVSPVRTGELVRLLTRLEFFSFMDRLGLDPAAADLPAEEGAGPTAQTPAPAALTVVEGASPRDFLTGEPAHLDLLAEYAGGALAALWTVRQTAGGAVEAARFEAGQDGYDELSALLRNGTIPKRTHDLKPLSAALLKAGNVPAGFVMDTLLAAYLLNPLGSDYGLERLSQEYGVTPPAEGEELPAAAKLASLLPAVADRLEREIAEREQGELLRGMEIPLAVVLANMENEGFAADGAGIEEFGRLLQTRLEECQRVIYDAVGYEFNLNSPKQLAVALFEDLGLPAKKKTKTGYSTNAEVLEGLREAHPAVATLLDYRMLQKLKSTYCDGLIKVIGADGRIHSSFNQTETRTGRISSTEPNLQNIPVRQELGRELRRFFRAREGWTLVDADYSQIELRVLAHMAGDPTMTSAFNNGDDIHRITAAQVFGVPEEMVTPLMRSRAKAVNFGIVYGIGAHSLSQDIGVSFGEAKTYIEEYLAHYASVAGFMDRMIAEAKEKGYAETLFGRRRPLPELNAGNGVTRSFGERVARNMPIQGTAADIIKLAMVRVCDRLRAEGLRSRLILQVHDELIVEAPLDEAERAAVLLREEMEGAANLSVKLSADVHTGTTWYDAKG
ncbi:MAG: DNA polymerase I [Clostridiales bacterium]|nr:DNA polymerase I [Clostridiales bacterium]